LSKTQKKSRKRQRKFSRSFWGVASVLKYVIVIWPERKRTAC